MIKIENTEAGVTDLKEREAIHHLVLHQEAGVIVAIVAGVTIVIVRMISIEETIAEITEMITIEITIEESIRVAEIIPIVAENVAQDHDQFQIRKKAIGEIDDTETESHLEDTMMTTIESQGDLLKQEENLNKHNQISQFVKLHLQSQKAKCYLYKRILVVFIFLHLK